MIIDIFERRIERLRAILKKSDIDAMVILAHGSFNAESLYYLCGLRVTAGIIAIFDDAAELFVDARYILQAREVAPHLLTDVGAARPLDATIASLKRRDVQRVGYESRRMTASTRDVIAKNFPDIIDASWIMPELRREKDKREISLIKEAASVATRAFTEALSGMAAGMSERDFANLLDSRLRAGGSEGNWGTDYMVASGARSAQPHGAATGRKISPSESVTVDLGARVGGYVSDVTRTFSIGRPSEIFLERFAILKVAHIAAAEMIAPNVRAAHIDASARNVVASSGLGGLFIHGTGHGIGLELHERPNVALNSSDVLRANDVITVEPGIYEPGAFGLRLEDDYLVTESGAERLSGLALEHFVV